MSYSIEIVSPSSPKPCKVHASSPSYIFGYTNSSDVLGSYLVHTIFPKPTSISCRMHYPEMLSTMYSSRQLTLVALKVTLKVIGTLQLHAIISSTSRRRPCLKCKRDEANAMYFSFVSSLLSSF